MRFCNPENFKQGQLLLSRYYPRELGLVIGSIITSVILTIVVGNIAIGIGKPFLLALLFLLSLVPAGLGFFFMNPLEGYHNAYYYFKLKYANKRIQKKYMWEGIQYDDSDDF